MFIDDDDLPLDDGLISAHVKNYVDPACVAVSGRQVLDVAIPDIPAIEVTEEDAEPPPSTPTTESSTNVWSSATEGPKLAEARAKMMEVLGSGAASGQEPWASSDGANVAEAVPEKPSALEWPEPPPIIADLSKGAPPPVPSKGR